MPPEEPFKDLIQRDSDICNNCFREVRRTFERKFAKRTFRRGGETLIWWKQVDLPPRAYTNLDNTEYMAAELPSHGTFIVCVCGVPGFKIRPVPKDKAIRYAHRIADRLEEKGLTPDRDTLIETVDELLSRPKMQGRQDEVFDKSVRRAL